MIIMRKYILFLLIALLTLSLCGCDGTAVPTPDTSSPADSVSPSPDASTETDIPDPSESPEPTETPVVKLDNEDRASRFLSYIEENYDKLLALCHGYIAGIGFIDLDCDTGIEMLIFDGGASAAMGVQFFDIVEDSVECISASSQPENAEMKGKYYTDVYVNANLFEDFRRLKDNNNDEEFFIVESGNGAIDFIYRELIRFGCGDKGQLTLEALMYKYEEYDMDTGKLLSTKYTLSGQEASQTKYDEARTALFSKAEDTKYEASGVFLWEEPGSSAEMSSEKLLDMAKKAIDRWKESETK